VSGLSSGFVDMATWKRFEEIDGWKLARELTRQIYEITSIGPFARDYSLRDQIRRASVSVMSNIAEGFERDGNKEFCSFLSIAKASAAEVRSQLYVALDQSYISVDQFNAISEAAAENTRVIGGLMKYLRQSEIRGLKFKSIGRNPDDPVHGHEGVRVVTGNQKRETRN
jgi:four helix bundle protein